ncbi:MAG: hypothetical protein Q8Q12_09405 [bacterium]|nr:hypothetical protein [bacterium]
MRFALAAAASVTTTTACAQQQKSPRAGWNFAFKHFVIAAWNPPAATEAEYRVYRDAGFNIVMSPRYALPDNALDLAQEHGLKVLIDTYTPNDKPWGGTAGKYTPHPDHHPATLPELVWLHERYGKHAALAGYLLGDDYGNLPQELVETTQYLRKNAPRLFPWVCQNVMSPKSLAQSGNPIMNPQIYPTLYQKNRPVDEQARLYCEGLNRLRESCKRYNLIMWPMFNVAGVESDSLIRFQVFSSLAYGSQGVWYFVYSGALQRGTDFKSLEEAKANLRPIWETAKKANACVAEWGPRLLGRSVAAVYHTGWSCAGVKKPSTGRWVESMDDDVLVGVLTKDGESPLAVVVDKRVALQAGAVPEREVTVRFGPAVSEILLISGRMENSTKGRTIKLKLEGGGAQLLVLRMK